jgi:hypothetical protein
VFELGHPLRIRYFVLRNDLRPNYPGKTQIMINSSQIIIR